VFADSHALRIETQAVDLLLDETPRSADLVVVHSLFRHLPRELHVATLRKFAGWLRAGGRVLFENKLEDGRETKARADRRPKLVERLRDGLSDGRLEVGESPAEFEARLSRRETQKVDPVADYATLDELNSLFAEANMTPLETKVVTREVAAYGPGVMRTRAVTVLKRSSP
jgi:hypothetical protein